MIQGDTRQLTVRWKNGLRLRRVRERCLTGDIEVEPGERIGRGTAELALARATCRSACAAGKSPARKESNGAIMGAKPEIYCFGQGYGRLDPTFFVDAAPQNETRAMDLEQLCLQCSAKTSNFSRHVPVSVPNSEALCLHVPDTFFTSTCPTLRSRKTCFFF